MKNFKNYQEFALFTIRENLYIAKHCLNTPKRKNTNSCYGMSALILLSSVIDTIGSFYKEDRDTIIIKQNITYSNSERTSTHFKMFYKNFLRNVCEENLFMTNFYSLARCRAIHNSTLGAKLRITINKLCDNTLFLEKKGRHYLNIQVLYDITNNALEKLNDDLSVDVTNQNERPGPTTGATNN